MDSLLTEPTMINIISGEKDNSRMKTISYKTYLPHKIIVHLTPTSDQKRLKDKGYVVTNLPVAFICKGKTCLAPAYNEKEIDERLKQ